jgi:hypothetical protein
VAVASVASVLLGAARARADGAFPASQSVMLPRDRAHEIVLATTFGLLFTEDDGAHWAYTCEDKDTINGKLYTVGAPPDDRIYAVSDLGAPFTSDGACTWTLGAGTIASAIAVCDVFPDPSDSTRVFAIASEVGGCTDGPMEVYRSLDGGQTYVGPLSLQVPNSKITGIEVAASAPRTLYATLLVSPGTHPRLARSDDSGDTWTTIDIEPGIGAMVPSIAAVSATDAQVIYLHTKTDAGAANPVQGLAISTDGGTTWSTPLVLPGAGADLTGFARLPDGTLVAVGLTAGPMATGIPTLFQSDDGGMTFTNTALSFHPVGLGRRDSTIFVATNDYVDGFALTSSADLGHTWTPRLRFQDINDIKACMFTECRPACAYLAGTTLFPAAVCDLPTDGPTGGDTTTPSSGGGCACGVVGAGANGVGLVVALLVGGWLAGRGRRRPPRRAA